MVASKVFLSYSHDSATHKQWVAHLATRLRQVGVDAILDQFELVAGDDVPLFMERGVRESDKVLLVCTARYVAKANDRDGGAGYESMIVSAELAKNIQRKFIPIVRDSAQRTVPTFVESKLYVDFSADDEFEASLDNLVRSINDGPLLAKPPLGQPAEETVNGSFPPKLADSRFTPVEMRVISTMTRAYNDSGSHWTKRNLLARSVGISLAQLFVAANSLKQKNIIGFASGQTHGDADLSILERGLFVAVELGLGE